MYYLFTNEDKVSSSPYHTAKEGSRLLMPINSSFYSLDTLKA